MRILAAMLGAAALGCAQEVTDAWGRVRRALALAEHRNRRRQWPLVAFCVSIAMK